MKKKKFLHFPEYPGGKSELRRYISDNLKYPEMAIQNRISGTVWLSAEVDDNGRVSDIIVERGLGFGCDEEAIRLVSALRYGGVSNRGMRVKVRHRFRIRFDLNEYLKKSSQAAASFTGFGQGVVYSFKPADKSKKGEGHDQSAGKKSLSGKTGSSTEKSSTSEKKEPYVWNITYNSP